MSRLHGRPRRLPASLALVACVVLVRPGPVPEAATAREAGPPAPKAGPSACVEGPEAHRFDFWPGTWIMESRRLDAAGDWQETRNRLRAEEILGGCAFIDFTDGDYGTGRLRGMGSRYYDPASGTWHITWMSTESPGTLETWEGGFDDRGVGEFFAEIETSGDTILSRLRWWDIRQDSAKWEHAISRDGGETWTPTWRITMRRDGDGR